MENRGPAAAVPAGTRPAAGTMPAAGTEVRLVQLPVDALRALVEGDLPAASRAAGVELTPYFVEHAWLWSIRLEQIERDASAAAWIARAALIDDLVVGHVGFHGPPDRRGAVEVAYSVDPRYRCRGVGGALLATALRWAGRSAGVTAVRASISPANLASLALIKGRGFVLVDLVEDPEDGPELVFELALAG